MRGLVIVVAVLAALYGGAWVAGERLIEARAALALDDLRAEGWTVDYDDLNTTGFPSRFDTTVTGLALATPDGSLAWAAPFVQVMALSYRPNRVIAVWPHEQAVTVGGQTFAVASEDLRASASAGLSTALPFGAATLQGHALRIVGAGPAVEAARILVAVRDAGAAETTVPGGEARGYDVHLDAQSLAVGGRLLLDGVTMDAMVELDSPLRLRPPERGLPPSVVAVELRGLRFARGAQAIEARGRLVPDAGGIAEGTVTLVAEGWRGLLDAAVESGLLDEGRRALAERALEGLAQGEDRIVVPVTFGDGWISALGLPLLAAPRLR